MKMYPLPMFVNAALNRPHVKPGDCPSGGPLPHIIDIWRAGMPSWIFSHPIFITPTSSSGAISTPDQTTRSSFLKFVLNLTLLPKYIMRSDIIRPSGLGLSIESTVKPAEEPLGKSYEILTQLAPLIFASRGGKKLDGLILDKTKSSEC